MNPSAGSYLTSGMRRHLNECALDLTASYISDTYTEDAPSRFYSLVCSLIEDHLAGSLDDLDLPSLDGWRGEQEAA